MQRKINICYLVLALIIFCAMVSASISAVDEGGFVYKSVCTSEKKIALTFDDGPHSVYTEKILEILKEYDIKATFFIIGKNAKEYPETLRLIKNEGHEIGNHTYDHEINLKNKKRVKNEISKTAEIIFDICGYETNLFRAPGGVVTSELEDISKDMGYKIILWNVDTRDWAHSSVKNITENVMKNTKSGSIILFHDYISGKTPTPEALKIIIPRLIDKGYEFCTVSELLEYEQK